MFWYSPDERDEISGQPGAVCYVERGARFGAGQWRDLESKLFNRAEPCR